MTITGFTESQGKTFYFKLDEIVKFKIGMAK